MGQGASKSPNANSGVNTTGAGAPPAVSLSSTPTNNSTRNAGRNAAYNALNATNKALVDNVRKTYGRPNMPVQEALNLGAVPTVANSPAPTQGGRRKTRKAKKSKKSKRTGRK